MPRIRRDEGRLLFGADPAGYDLARPGHAERVYDVLVERCGLGSGTSVLEVGPGTGQATRRLLELGAGPLVALEPNPELAAYLRRSLGERLVIHETALEDAELPAGSFDLAAAASSFHWVEEDIGLARILGALRPGGWFAMWWTLFGDRSKPDAFIAATTPLLESLDSSPTKGEEGRPSHGRDREARVAALDAAGFVDVEHELAEWEASWDTAGIRALYGSFSPILRLDERRRMELLDEIARIADEDFGGRVSRALTTSLYTARRPGVGRARNSSYNSNVAAQPQSRTMLPVHEAPTCSVAGAAEIVGSKWTVLIVHDLSEGPRRFTQLERSCAGISPRTLAERLRWLESEEIVVRQSYPESPPRVEYALTPKGEALLPVVHEMRRFGHDWLGCGVHDATGEASLAPTASP